MEKATQQIMERREPHLRLAVTPDCNFKCIYCKPGGEGLCKNGELMTAEEIVKIVDLSSQAGFKYVKFTGGEPLLRGEIVDIVRETRKIRGIEEIGLVTNGSLLTENLAVQLASAGLDRIAVSLDAVDPETFARISGKRCYDRVLDGIKAAKKSGIPFTLNAVLMRLNMDEVDRLIEVASKYGTKLKFIDFMKIDSNGLWEQEYVPPAEICRKLERLAVESGLDTSFSGLGTPLSTYKMRNGLEVRVKDATVGTNYHESCKSCINYPCQDAIIALRITHDGKLKKCVMLDDDLPDALTPLRAGNYGKVELMLREAYSIFANAEYFPNAWKPKFGQEVK